MKTDPLLIKEYWEREYESATTPFDNSEPDEWIAALEKDGKIRGNVLDSGCGPGRTSTYLASRGYTVLGADISTNAIGRAKQRADGKGLRVDFLAVNVCELRGYDNHFDTVVDVGCFHSLNDNARAPYAAALHRMCRTGAIIYLRAFSTANLRNKRTSDVDRPALSESEIRTAFSLNGWFVNDLVEREIELFITEDVKPTAYCWFAELHYA